MNQESDRPGDSVYEQLAEIGKALGSPVRMRLLDQLEPHERSVEELATAAGIGVKNASAQLARLRAAHLVRSRRAGAHVYYRLADDGVSRFLGLLHEFAGDRLSELRAAWSAELGDLAALRQITVDELADELADPDVVLIDVRSPEDYARAHIPGAISLPSDQLLSGLDRLPTDRDIVAYCSGPYCIASPRAVALLQRHGRRARSLSGGAVGWRRSGRELVPSEGPPP